MQILAPLPRRSGRIAYAHAQSGDVWGMEEFVITRDRAGMRTSSVHCEMQHGSEDVVRDTVLSVHDDWHPHDCFVRILNHGKVTGTGWFRFSDTEAECESWCASEGRISQRIAISRPMRGFGIHALMGDGWMAANFPFHEGAGHVHRWDHNLIHSLHHFGATGPFIHTSNTGFRFVGKETVTVPAGTFECHRIQFVGMSNNHPPYDIWISTCSDCLYVKGVVEGYMDSIFHLIELEGEAL